MEKCKFCGAEVPDGSNFCVECGKPVSQGNVCPHCGASVNDGDSFCQNCGKKIDGVQSTFPVESTPERCPHCGTPVSKDSVFCENCGKKIDGNQLTPPIESAQEECPGNDTPSNDGGIFFENCEKEVYNEPSNTSNRQQPQPTNGNLVIRWDGAWLLVDYKIKLNVNGDNIGEYSLKEGFETSVPITSSYTTVVTKLSFFKTKEELILNPNENYTYELVYHKASGWLGFILYDSLGNELRRDKLHWGMFLLSFLFPIVGVIYAICVWKKKPASSYTAIYISILGVIISLIVTSNLPPLSKFVHLPQNSAIESDVILTDLSDDSDARLDDAMSPEQVIEEKKHFLESFYKKYDSLDEYDEAFIKSIVTNNALQILKKHYTRDEGGDMSDPNGLACWLFNYYNGWVAFGSVISRNITSKGGNMFVVSAKYEDVEKYEVELSVIKDGDSYKIDDINPIGSDMSDDETEIKSQEELAQTNTAIGAFDVKGEDNDSIQ